MMTVQINSLDYVRNNVIALNSVASSSQKQAEEMRQYAEHARQDTRHMRRLAFLTMCYLPSTTVAVCVLYKAIHEDLTNKRKGNF